MFLVFSYGFLVLYHSLAVYFSFLSPLLIFFGPTCKSSLKSLYNSNSVQNLSSSSILFHYGLPVTLGTLLLSWLSTYIRVYYLFPNMAFPCTVYRILIYVTCLASLTSILIVFLSTHTTIGLFLLLFIFTNIFIL
jgi:hypothetical protein